MIATADSPKEEKYAGFRARLDPDCSHSVIRDHICLD
jgi:hypothetical protein